MEIRAMLVYDQLSLCETITGVVSSVEGITLTPIEFNSLEIGEYLKQKSPDVILLGLDFSQWDIHQIITTLQRNTDYPPVFALVPGINHTLLTDLIQAGVTGCFLLIDPLKHLIAGLRIVTRGKRWFSPGLSEMVSATMVGDYASQLTKREIQILWLVALGLSNDKIAENLDITRRTVVDHTGNIYAKLGLENRAEAIAWVWMHSGDSRNIDR